MKKKILATTAALATIVGLSQIAKADDQGCKKQFTPAEELEPKVRMEVNSKAFELTKDLDVDWDKVVVGVNEKKEICFAIRTEHGFQTISGFSCYGNAGAKVEDR